MKQLLPSLFLVLVGLAANGQDIQSFRASLMQYQFNALPLNPAYAGRLEATSFEAFYFGNFASDLQVSRSAIVSLHGRAGASGQFGWGGVLQFHNQAYYNELNFHPCFARIIRLPNANLSVGATFGINYFDVDETVATNVSNSFSSVDGGLGIFLHNQRSFVGLSVPNIYETNLQKLDDDNGSLDRLRTVNLHAGSIFRINDEIYLKPVTLLRYARVYNLPKQGPPTDYSLVSADVHASVFVQGTYVIGLLAGYTRPEIGYDQTRLGLSATILFGNLRLGYAIQYNNQAATNVSLPATHTISAGYDFFENPEEGRRVF